VFVPVFVPLRERLLLGRSRGGRVVCLSLGLGACPWVVVVVPLGFAMSAVSSSSGVVVSVEVCSHSPGFGESVRLLSRLTWCSVTVNVCQYTGVAFLSAELLPAVVPVWPAIRSLAWSDGRSSGDAEDLFVARVSVGGDNARYFALEALLEAVELAPVVAPAAPASQNTVGSLLRAKLDELDAARVKRVSTPGYHTDRVVGVYYDGEHYCLLGAGVQGEEMWTEERADNYFGG